MRPPLRVEAKVAEELRNWLTSELERLDASNTNPFAHHVVTILLQEDLDIDDEPLSTDDCYDQWGLNTVKRSKTKDNQIKAAVQFLRSTIAHEECDESEIELIVNELVIRVEAAKRQLNQRKSRGRDLLGALTINTGSQVQHSSENVDRSYNEVFPSLPGETASPKVHSLSAVSPNNNVWNKSPGKENSQQVCVRRVSQRTLRKVHFENIYEAAAYKTAAHVCAFTLPETESLPDPETMEICKIYSLARNSVCHNSHQIALNPFGNCWKSAFDSMNPTKLFSPSTSSLPPKKTLPATALLKPVHIIQENSLENGFQPIISTDLFKIVDLLDPENQKVFLPVERVFTAPRPSSELYPISSEDPDDLEVLSITNSGQNARKLKLKKKILNSKLPPSDEEAKESSLIAKRNINDEIQGALVFPDHYGAYWDDMAKRGVSPMYPNLYAPVSSNKGNAYHHMSHKGTRNIKMRQAEDAGVDQMTEMQDRDTSSIAKEWASVTFTNNLCSYAMSQMSNKYGDILWGEPSNGYSVNLDDRKNSNLAAFEGGLFESPEARDEKLSPSDEYGSPVLEESIRGINPSSDSGILLHGAGDRASMSPSSEPSQSAPAAFQLPPRGWPLDGPNPCQQDLGTESELMASCQNDDSNCLLSLYELEDELHKFKAENNKYSSYVSDGDYFFLWAGESSFDHIRQSIFPFLMDMTDFTFSDPCQVYPTAADNIISEPASSPLTSTPIPRQISEALTSPTVISITERSGHPQSSPIAYHMQMISESQAAIAAAPLPVTSPALFPSHAISTYFMPSHLSPGMGMDKDVAHTLQSAYVNSIFSNNVPSESMPALKKASGVITCSELENAWFSSNGEFANEGLLLFGWQQIRVISCSRSCKQLANGKSNLNRAARTMPAPDSSIVKGRTCSKWLENSCDLGSACPFSHPSL